MTKTPGQRMRLQIEKIVYGGRGIAHPVDEAQESKTVFVPFTLPHEIVDACLVEERTSYAEADLLHIEKPSPYRTEPRCVHFGICGGCQYQHATYDEQLRLKMAILEETLLRAGLSELPAIAVHAADPWEYRNRIRLRVMESDGHMRVGYLQRSSAEFFPVEMCPIAAPVLWRAAEALLTLSGSALQWVKSAEEVEFFTTPDEKSVQMTLYMRRELRGFSNFCEALRVTVPELIGAGVALLEGSGRRKSLRIRQGSVWGADGLSYIAGGDGHWVSRGGFFQVNRFMVDRLVGLVTSGREGHLAWDLYAGVGLFSRVLANSFDEVIAVEAAAGDLMRSFRGKGRRAVAATTVEFLRQAILQRERPDLVVVDPPRAGVGTEVCTLLARMQPEEIVYVSCDPSTLGRDLRAMVDSGYNLRELHMVDMFPQTFHQETVAVLRR